MYQFTINIFYLPNKLMFMVFGPIGRLVNEHSRVVFVADSIKHSSLPIFIVNNDELSPKFEPVIVIFVFPDTTIGDTE